MEAIIPDKFVSKVKEASKNVLNKKIDIAETKESFRKLSYGMIPNDIVKYCEKSKQTINAIYNKCCTEGYYIKE